MEMVSNAKTIHTPSVKLDCVIMHNIYMDVVHGEIVDILTLSLVKGIQGYSVLTYITFFPIISD